MSTRGQGHSLTFGQDSHSKTISYKSKATGPVVIKFYVEPPGAEGTKMFIHFRSHDKHGNNAHVW